MFTDEVAVSVLAENVIKKQILSDDDVTFHTHDFGDMRDTSRTVTQTRGLNDDIDGTADHFPDRARRKRIPAHRNHRFKARERFARHVGVQRAHRTVVAGVHRLQQVEGFRSAHLANDDPLGPHAQTIAHQVTHRDLALAFEVRRPRLQTDHVRLLQLQFRRIFAGDDALIIIDVTGQTVQQRGFARAGASRDQNIHPAAADDLENFRPFG